MKKIAKWVIIYWMPYDNNLSRLKEEIIEMLTKGCKSADIIIYVFSDSYEDEYIQKTGITNGEIFEKMRNQLMMILKQHFRKDCFGTLRHPKMYNLR